MLIDEFIPNVPAIADIEIYNDVIYFRNQCEFIKGKSVIKNTVIPKTEKITNELLGLNNSNKDDVLIAFLNCNTSSSWKKFIASYGLLESSLATRQEYSVKHAKEINGYFPVDYLKNYRELQENIAGMLYYIDDDTSEKAEFLPHLIKMFKNNSYTKYNMSAEQWNEFKNDDLLWIIDDYLSELNNECNKVRIVIEHDDNMNFNTVVHYTSLKQVLYVMLRNRVTSTRFPKQCAYKGCRAWFEYKTNKNYCCPECAARAQQETKARLEKNDKKEYVYKKVLAHIYNSVYDRRRNSFLTSDFDYDIWKRKAVLIKKDSAHFYRDLDDLCKQSCLCKKCTVGIASFFKNEFEQKRKGAAL